MDYKNLLSRLIISLVFITLYIFILIYDFKIFFYIIIMIYLLIFIEVILFFKKFMKIILIFLFISFLSIFFIDFTDETFVIFNLMIIVIITFDVFSYFIGSLYGSTKILPNLSPNKTFEGLIGGLLFSLIISITYLISFGTEINYLYIILVLIILCSSFLGDIIESKFKRLNNIKNSSNFLLGHGGFFDRFDSFVFSIIPYTIITNLL